MTEATKYKKAIFWHRRDLRFSDNTGLFQALKNAQEVQPVFIFDKCILDQLSEDDQRVHFIHAAIKNLKASYQKVGADLEVLYGNPVELIPELISKLEADALFLNHDYEAYALERDQQIESTLRSHKVSFLSFKDQVIFEKSEVVKDDGKPYVVFTPYSKKWKGLLDDFQLKTYPVEKYSHHLLPSAEKPLIDLNSMGFLPEASVDFPADTFSENLIQSYSEKRDIPALNATSRLSVHLRFGTISIRKLVSFSRLLNETFLNELIWRDFYQQILYHFPHSARNAFRVEYDQIEWLKDEKSFDLWCQGKTGYPLVDAGMRELNQTGFMHNRVRMVVASFLSKHLLLDWRWGEAYFAQKLLDYDLASNVGGWQWAAGCGCDAAPYFRVFNPQAQQEKFDPDWKYIRTWVPEFGTPLYPQPIVEHKMARERAISHYKKYLKNSL